MEFLRLVPERASTIADRIDLLLVVLTGLAGFFTLLVCGLLVFFSVRYRHQAEVDRTLRSPDNTKLEITWTVVPTLMVIALFVWAAWLYFDFFRVPVGAQEILVTGKQWMWKVQHPNGRREINQLHVPVGQPIRLTMTSEDVIHSFFVPAFRVKKDVLPGRYSTLWFEPSRTGEYHLFCAEYCGLNHSTMIGKVVVMERPEYERWLREGNPTQVAQATGGEGLFQQMGCAVCHNEGATARGPVLAGVFGSEVQLKDGTTVVADEDYIRESIENPRAKIVAGYTPIMPTYKNQLDQQDIFELVSYIKSLQGEGDARSAT